MGRDQRTLGLKRSHVLTNNLKFNLIIKNNIEMNLKKKCYKTFFVRC